MSPTGGDEPAAGPPRDEAAYRRVRDFLVERGTPEREVAQALEDDVLHLLVADALVLPTSPTSTALQVAEATGLGREHLDRLWRALGFPVVGEDEMAFSEPDVEAVRNATELLAEGLVDLDEMIQLTRVAGSSMARVADAEVAATTRVDGRAGSLASADLLVTTGWSSLTTTARLLEYVWRRHLRAALRRAALVRPGDLDRAVGGPGGRDALVIGFADLVGFTAQAQHLSQAALAELVSRFEALAYDTVVDQGGRVVKMIGDEVMFVLDEPAAGVELGLALAEAYADDQLLPEVRVALACGEVLARDGDFYGATVNLAHRIVKVASPGSVVVNDTVHEALQGDERYAWRTITGRHLKDIGRVDLHVARRAGAAAEAESDAEGLGLTERARRVGEERVRLFVSEAVQERLEPRVREQDRS